MNNYVILRRNAWRNANDLERAAGLASRVANEEMPGRVRWIRSYICEEADGSLGRVCVLQALDVEAAREQAQRAHMPYDAILPIARAVVISDDPTG